MSEPSTIGRIQPGPVRDRSHISPVTSREELIYLLSRACELEHGLACIYLFAAHSLKGDLSEGGMDADQLAMVRRWRRHLAKVAVEEMLHLAQASNMLTAIGGAPNFRRTNFPMPPSAYPFGVALTLEPFSTLTIERFVTYELPEAGLLSPEAQEVCDAVRARVLDAQGSPVGAVGPSAGAACGLEPFDIDFATVGELYHKIETGFWAIPEEDLFIGPPEAQANGRYLDFGGELVAVVDRDSACRAIDMIVEQGEAPTQVHPDAHYAIFDAIRRELEQAKAAAEATGVPFEPVRPVTPNPMTRFYDDTSGGTIIAEALTHQVADLYNVAYDTMLLMLLRFFSHTDESEAELAFLSRATLRLMTSVLRPLGDALCKMPIDTEGAPGRTAGPGFGYNRDVHLLSHKASAWIFFGERLFELARSSTKLWQADGVPTEVQEAAATLQDLACGFAPATGRDDGAGRVAALAELQAGRSPGIMASRNGPYLVTNATRLEDWLGVALPARPLLALCRCGCSAIKPLCDGSHARVGFSGAKEDERVPDRRDRYAGAGIVVTDNRGICAHAGFCSDALATVFRPRLEPFVDPDGGSPEDIVRAVRACPSGALGLVASPAPEDLGGVGAGAGGGAFGDGAFGVDAARPPAILVSRDGPYRVTGGIPLTDEHGDPESWDRDATREHYSLCRCGQSLNKPLCSGRHWYVGFHDPLPAADRDPTPFEWAGGLPALRRWARLAHEKYLAHDPLLAGAYPAGAGEQSQRVAALVGQVLGGPPAPDAGPEALLPAGLSEVQRSRWVAVMAAAASEALLPSDAEFRAALVAYLEGASGAATTPDPAARSAAWEHWSAWTWTPAGPPRPAPVTPEAAAVPAEPAGLPGPGEAISFAAHIRPLFRDSDRKAMAWAFDLWSYTDVAREAEPILETLRKGTMPCDGVWPGEQVAVFERWIEAGTPQ